MIFSFLATSEFSSALKAGEDQKLENIVNALQALCEINLSYVENTTVIPPSQLSKIRKIVKSIVIGKTGYAYILDREGNLIIHPTKEGENIIDWKDTKGNYFIREMIEEAISTGGSRIEEIRYPWVNVELGETSPRIKIVKFRYLPQLGWIIAAGSYEVEIFEAVYDTEKTVIILATTSLVIVFIFMIMLARFITRPILQLTSVSSRMAEGEFSLRVDISQHDEIGQLAHSFNRMVEQIQQYTQNLEEAVAQRTQELADSKEGYKKISTLLTNILESSTEYAIVAVDLEGEILEFNMGARNLFGWTREEMIGEKISKTYANSEDCILEREEFLGLEKGLAIEKEAERGRKNGESFLGRMVITAMRNAKGELFGYLEISRDVTERQRLERELKETKDYLENILESSVDGIITTDQKGYLTRINRGLEEILHVKKKDIIGKHVSALYLDGIAEARKIMSILRRDHKFSNYKMTLVDRDGREVPINTSAALLKNFRGETIGTAGIFQDLTEKIKLETNLQKAEASLIQSAKMRELGDLVSGVAHEINNPLMASQTILYRIKENLHRDCPNERLIDLIVRCNDRIATIVNHLREFSRETETHFEPLDIIIPINNSLLITEQQLLDHNIKIIKDFPPELPQVIGSASQLEQVFLNIISNARDALDKQESDKELIIRSFYRLKDESPGEVVISFTDTGPGISPEIRYKIFDPFFSTKEVGSGTGLGLSICYGIVEKHGGRIEMDSEVGKGATFRVILPVIASNNLIEKGNTGNV
ncbi:MAG: PAS domain S-box protein [Pseudomonadota bacterium]